MKKEFCIVIAALLVLSLTACGKSKSANSVPLVDCSDHGSAVEGGCYLMTEETPDEICEEAKVIFSENLAQWVSVFEGGAGEYALGTPYHTHPLDSNGKPTDAYIFPVLHNGEFWRTLDIIELDGETRHQFSPTAEKFQRLHGLSSPENPIGLYGSEMFDMPSSGIPQKSSRTKAGVFRITLESWPSKATCQTVLSLISQNRLRLLKLLRRIWPYPIGMKSAPVSECFRRTSLGC